MILGGSFVHLLCSKVVFSVFSFEPSTTRNEMRNEKWEQHQECQESNIQFFSSKLMSTTITRGGTSLSYGSETGPKLQAGSIWAQARKSPGLILKARPRFFTGLRSSLTPKFEEKLGLKPEKQGWHLIHLGSKQAQRAYHRGSHLTWAWPKKGQAQLRLGSGSEIEGSFHL